MRKLILATCLGFLSVTALADDCKEPEIIFLIIDDDKAEVREFVSGAVYIDKDTVSIPVPGTGKSQRTILHCENNICIVHKE